MERTQLYVDNFTLQGASLRAASLSDNDGNNFHFYDLVLNGFHLDETTFARWMSDVKLQSGASFEAKVDKTQLKFLLLLPYQERSNRAQKAFLHLFTSSIKTLI